MESSFEFTVHVTDDHIEHGVREDCDNCPVALATIVALNAHGISWGGVAVDGDGIDLDTDHGLYYAVAPQPMTAFIHAFDRGGEVAPFSARLVFEHVEDCIYDAD